MTNEDINTIEFYRKAIASRRNDIARYEKKLKNIIANCDHKYSDGVDATNYGVCKICGTNGLYYIDTRYCEHCEKDTLHDCRDSQDASDDYQSCQICNWFMTSYTGEYIKGV